jgi:hypothetical protein
MGRAFAVVAMGEQFERQHVVGQFELVGWFEQRQHQRRVVRRFEQR